MARSLILVWMLIVLLAKPVQAEQAEGYAECQSMEVYALDGAVVSPLSVAEFYAIWKDQLDVLLVGERHGVAAHPKIVACLLAEATHSKTALILEMFKTDQQDIIDQHREVRPELFGKIVSKIKWWETGWPSWSIYSPMFDVAWIGRMGVVGADLPNGQDMEIETAYSGVTPAEFEVISKGWSQSMFQAHCGLISEAQADEKGLHQMRRDAWMAEQIVAAGSAYPKLVFYSGRAHVREDRGLVRLVRENLFGRRVASLALREENLTKKEDRTELLSAYQGKYNFVAFIGTYSRVGLC